jgi:hypothetical protein
MLLHGIDLSSIQKRKRYERPAQQKSIEKV